VLSADSFIQVRHLDRRQSRFQSLVTALQAGTIDRLFERIAGENAEGMRNSGFLSRLADATRDFVGDYVIVQRIAAEKATDTDDGVVFASLSERAGGGGDLERAGDTDNVYSRDIGSCASQTLVRTLKQAFCYELIKAGNDDGKSFARRAQITIDCARQTIRNAFDFESRLVLLRSNKGFLNAGLLALKLRLPLF
jgi:hypothetical protein